MAKGFCECTSKIFVDVYISTWSIVFGFLITLVIIYCGVLFNYTLLKKTKNWKESNTTWSQRKCDRTSHAMVFSHTDRVLAMRTSVFVDSSQRYRPCRQGTYLVILWSIHCYGYRPYLYRLQFIFCRPRPISLHCSSPKSQPMEFRGCRTTIRSC